MKFGSAIVCQHCEDCDYHNQLDYGVFVARFPSSTWAGLGAGKYAWRRLINESEFVLHDLGSEIGCQHSPLVTLVEVVPTRCYLSTVVRFIRLHHAPG